MTGLSGMDGRKEQRKSAVSTMGSIESFRDGVATAGSHLRQLTPVVWLMEPPRRVGHSIDLKLQKAQA